jgi:nucleoside-diphosphate-sugar epimerase
MRALVIGCGYLGRRVAAIWRSKGHVVCALTRSDDRAQELRDRGIEPIVGDISQPQTLSSLPSADVVLYAVGYDRRAGIPKRDLTVSGLKNVLTALAGQYGRLVYVSTTSVYGQQAGEWVDEASPCQPQGEDGRIALEAEQIARQFFPGEPVRASEARAARAPILLRFSGIYGPGRLLRRVESLRNREPLHLNPDGFLNLIHVDDGARIAVQAAERGIPGSTYLVTDDKPVRRREYYHLLAKLIGAPVPLFEIDEAEATRFNKRCSNARVRAAFSDAFQFPTIETGLPHAIRQ